MFCVDVQYIQCSVLISSIYSVRCWCPVYTVFGVGVQYIHVKLSSLSPHNYPRSQPSPHNYPRSQSCQASISISTQLPTITVMSSFHLHLHTITHDQSYVKLPSPSPHNYPRSQSCQAPISISTQLPTITAMSSSHFHLHTITHDHSHVKLPSLSPHNYP